MTPMTTDTTIKNLILRAESLAKRNWIHAVNLLEDALTENPDNHLLCLALGDVYVRAGQFRKAIVHFQEALAAKPSDTHLALHIGNCYLALNEYNLALTYYDKVQDLPLDLMYNKAIALAYQGQLHDSIQLLHQFLRSVDNSLPVYYLLIEMYIRIQDLDSASHYIGIVETKWGSSKHNLLLKAIVYAKREVWLVAFHAFSEYDVGDSMDNTDHLYTYAICADKIGQSHKAVKLLQRGIAINPYSTVMYEDLVRVLLQIGEYEEAYRTLKKAKSCLLRLTPLLYLMKEKLASHDNRFGFTL